MHLDGNNLILGKPLSRLKFESAMIARCDAPPHCNGMSVGTPLGFSSFYSPMFVNFSFADMIYTSGFYLAYVFLKMVSAHIFGRSSGPCLKGGITSMQGSRSDPFTSWPAVFSKNLNK